MARRPLAEWLERRGRFVHPALPGPEELVDRLQRWVDDSWGAVDD